MFLKATNDAKNQTAAVRHSRRPDQQRFLAAGQGMDGLLHRQSHRAVALPLRPSQSLALQRKCACGGASGPTGECAECKAKQEAAMQRRTVQDAAPDVAPPIVHDVIRSPGQPLDAQTRSFMEQRFGYDFQDVRVHSGSRAGRSAQAVNALAYTVGADVVFGALQYAPETPQGRRLLAHELTHVLQQNRGQGRRRTSQQEGSRAPQISNAAPAQVSRQDIPYPGAISYCRGIGVPCPAPYFHHGTACRLVTCRRSTTANLPFAISPGVCIYQCSDGQICACVLFGTSTSAVCTFTFCDIGQASADADYDNIASQALAMAMQQRGGQTPDAGNTPQPADDSQNPIGIQAKLKVGSAHDEFEREADAVSERVMRMTDSEVRSTSSNSPARVSRSSAGSPVVRRQNDPNQPTLGNFQLTPPNLPPPPLLYPGQLRETIILPAPPDITLTPPSSLLPPPGPSIQVPGLTPLTPPSFSPVIIIPVPRCVPDTSLTWADFQGSPSGSFSAQTSFSIPELNIQGNPMFQARINPAQSWVRPEFAAPANRATNGCRQNIQQCERFFQNHPGGGTWNLSGAPPANCPASIPADPTVIAQSQGDCAALIGAECDRVAQLESDRLLSHEQTHFNIACVLANKADDALAAGTSLAAVRAAINTNKTSLTNRYDTQSAHGCNAAGQATWDADVAAGLPNTTIP